jgi:hypothetical protein
MATTVLTGASNPTYTNNTGQNVRVIINYATNVTKTNIAGFVNNAANAGGVSENVTFSVTRDGADVDTITFTGPNTFTFSNNNTGSFTKSITYNVDYILSTSGSGPGGQALQIQASGSRIGLDDRRNAGADGDYNDITVTASKGTFLQVGANFYYRLNIGTTGYTVGKNLAFTQFASNANNSKAGYGYGSNMSFTQNVEINSGAIPTDFILTPGQSFSFTCNLYNIIVIPENS